MRYIYITNVEIIFDKKKDFQQKVYQIFTKFYFSRKCQTTGEGTLLIFCGFTRPSETYLENYSYIGAVFELIRIITNIKTQNNEQKQR